MRCNTLTTSTVHTPVKPDLAHAKIGSLQITLCKAGAGEGYMAGGGYIGSAKVQLVMHDLV